MKYQVTTFKLHRMPTLLIVRHGERCLRGWLAFATSPPGGKQRVWNGSRGVASSFVGSKFVFESPSTVWPLALHWAVGGWSCFATLPDCIDRTSQCMEAFYGGEVYGQPPYGGRGLSQTVATQRRRRRLREYTHSKESFSLGPLAIWRPLFEVPT